MSVPDSNRNKPQLGGVYSTMRRAITIGTICAVTLSVTFWFLTKYFAVEVQSMKSRLLPPPTTEQFESQHLRRTAGWFSRDCGVVKLHDDPSKAMLCASSAMRERHSFRVAFEWVGVDSHGLTGLAGTSSGDIYEITTDEMSAGGGIANAPPVRVVTVSKCGQPAREIAFGPRGYPVMSCLGDGTPK
jgi:hypothetical protein